MHALKRKNAFTLIETLIAVAILTIATAGPLFTASRALTLADLSNQQLIAAYLAQEGIEHVYMIRDNEYLAQIKNPPSAPTTVSDAAWTAFVTEIAPCTTSPFCTLDPTRSQIGVGNSAHTVQACSGACAPLYKNSTGYTQQSGGLSAISIYTRTLQIGSLSANEAVATSTVSWNFHGPHAVVVVGHLTKWQ